MDKIIKGLKIAYIESGNNNELPSILFLHGWGCSKEIFNHSIEILKDKYHVYSIDLPGFGESSEPKEGFSVDDYVDIVNEFIIEVMHSKKIILIGHSYGGRIIIKLNAKENRTYLIEKNILIDSAGIKEKLTLKQKIKVLYYKLGKKILSIPYAEKIFKKTLDEYKRDHGSSDYRNASNVMRDTLVKSVNEDLTLYLHKVVAPTLLIWGEKDKATPLSDAKIMEKEMRDAGLVVLKNCDHFSFLEDVNTYISVLKSFLNV